MTALAGVELKNWKSTMKLLNFFVEKDSPLPIRLFSCIFIILSSFGWKMKNITTLISHSRREWPFWVGDDRVRWRVGIRLSIGTMDQMRHTAEGSSDNQPYMWRLSPPGACSLSAGSHSRRITGEVSSCVTMSKDLPTKPPRVQGILTLIYLHGAHSA